jgi:hypothetical protein
MAHDHAHHVGAVLPAPYGSQFRASASRSAGLPELFQQDAGARFAHFSPYLLCSTDLNLCGTAGCFQRQAVGRVLVS